MADVKVTETKFPTPIEVAHAVLHNTMFVPNAGQFGPSLDKASAGSRIQSMRLEYLLGSQTLVVELTDKTAVKSTIKVLIPCTAVSHMVLAK